MTTGTAAALLNAARLTIGTEESPAGSNRQPFAACAGHADGYAWCLTWAVCMAKRAGVRLPRYDTAYTPTMVQAFKDDGRWGGRPAVGAFVFFRWPSLGRVAHVGIVEAVRSDGSIVSIEGNTDEAGGRTGGKVMRHVRRANIEGYGYPRYGQTQEDDMPLTEGDLGAIERLIETTVRTVLNEGTAIIPKPEEGKPQAWAGGMWRRMASAMYGKVSKTADAVERIEKRLAEQAPPGSPGDLSGEWEATFSRKT